MKNLILPLAIVLFVACGCASSQDTRLSSEPRSYDEAMGMLASEIQAIDKHVIGAQYNLAVPEAERAVAIAGALGRFDPARLGNDYAAYVEYEAQADDLHRAIDRLLFMIQQRRRDGAREQLENVARRYNFISNKYGPNRQVSVLERDPNDLRGPEFHRGDLPGELRGNR
ncbi:MAG: hypothetical protein KF754_13255 [Planctomycetes bacterium]|nr:hypothetical protein [Planctomycetota bacterium]